RQRRWIELFSDYECEIRYHPGKANVVVNALSRKERVKRRRVRAMAMTIQSGIRGMIMAAQGEAFKQENILTKRLHGLDQQIEKREDRSLYFLDRIWVPADDNPIEGLSLRSSALLAADQIDNSCISEGARRYGDFSIGVALGTKSMRNSTCRCSGNPDKSFGNTSMKSRTTKISLNFGSSTSMLLKALVIPGGLGCVLMQRGKVISYASRQLNIYEKNYTTHDLELGAVVFALKTWRHYLYGTKSVIYTDHNSLQHIFDQKELNMSQKRWIELFSDYECEIRYHPGKPNMVVDALSRKERVKPRHVRAMAMTIQYGIRGMIIAAQGEAFKQENILAERLHGLDQQMERREDGSLYFLDRIRVPLVGGVQTIIMNETHKTRYFVHFEADKMDHDIRNMYWWPGMKRDIAIYVSKCLKCSKTVQKALRTRLDMSMAYHPQTDGQSERTIYTLEDMLRACVIDFGGSWDVHLPLAEFSYNNSYHSSIRYSPFEALYGRKCRSPVLWAEIGESNLIGPELIQETTDKVVLIKEKLKAARDRQKSYADNRCKSLEFEVGDKVMLKVSPWKGVIRFGKKDKLAPRYVGPFEILERIGPVAYRLRLPKELSGVQDTFHVSNLKKCLLDASLHVLLDEIKIDKAIRFVEELVEIIDHEVERLKHSRISLVKVRWNSKRDPEFT
nr:retrotransposon protein, putative, Ty3-gypsy subclass [Tanacetum cinerariifolium]